MMKRLIIVFILLCLLLPLPIAADTIREFNITMTDTRESYQIQYSSLTATLNRYWVNSSVDLLNSQHWTIHGSEDGNAWSLIDEQVYTSLSANTPVEYVIGAPTNYSYYQFFMHDGFYRNGSVVHVNFSTDDQTLYPTRNLSRLFSSSSSTSGSTDTIYVIGLFAVSIVIGVGVYAMNKNKKRVMK